MVSNSATILNIKNIKSPVYFFKTANDFGEWLNEHHLKEKEIQLGYYKKKSNKYNYSWSETVDQGLCYGWIDGIVKTIDDISYTRRFTPRRLKSNWSDVNIKKADNLIREGMMKEAGIKAYERRSKSKKPKK